MSCHKDSILFPKLIIFNLWNLHHVSHFVRRKKCFKTIQVACIYFNTFLVNICSLYEWLLKRQLICPYAQASGNRRWQAQEEWVVAWTPCCVPCGWEKQGGYWHGVVMDLPLYVKVLPEVFLDIYPCVSPMIYGSYLFCCMLKSSICL